MHSCVRQNVALAKCGTSDLIPEDTCSKKMYSLNALYVHLMHKYTFKWQKYLSACVYRQQFESNVVRILNTSWEA